MPYQPMLNSLSNHMLCRFDRPQNIQWAFCRIAHVLDHMGVNHGGFHMDMTEIFLDLPDINALE